MYTGIALLNLIYIMSVPAFTAMVNANNKSKYQSKVSNKSSNDSSNDSKNFPWRQLVTTITGTSFIIIITGLFILICCTCII